MEIALLPQNGLRIKGKQGLIGVNTTSKKEQFNGIISLDGQVPQQTHTEEGSIIMQGAGSYEVSGIKVAGTRNGENLAYVITIDSVDVLVGKATALEKMHTKLKEPHILAVDVDEAIDLSFVASLAPRVMVFYGEKAEESLKKLAKEGIRKESKYVVTFDKLPQEPDEVLLQ